jgi:hypothetical protein
MKTLLRSGILLFVLIFITKCAIPLRSFKNSKIPKAPNYNSYSYWASLPFMKDSADFELPEYGVEDQQNQAKVDVFYIHPTNYISGSRWNASFTDSTTRANTDIQACKFQASVFNASCKIYAPRFRAAIFFSYFAPKKSADAAFDLAYKDVKEAFIYYLKHYNKNRPIIIASHSQGTDYGIRLIKDFFDNNKALSKKLVAAYLIGRPIYDTTFKTIKLSVNEYQTGGYVTWNSVSENTNTFMGEPVGNIVGVNPLSWKTDTVHVAASKNNGSLPFSFLKIEKQKFGAKLAPSGFLWVDVPKNTSNDDYKGTITPYYHFNDYSFFYMNIRENVAKRIESYYKSDKKNRS